MLLVLLSNIVEHCRFNNKGLDNGSNNIVVFLTICISYANNCFTL